MRTRDPRRRQRQARSGYTLVELLVVMVILGVVLALVTVNLSRGRGAMLEDDVRELALLLQHARDEALTGGQAIAWFAGPEGYRFSRRVSARGWIETDPRGNAALVARAWPREVRLTRLRIAGLPVSPSEPLIFSSSGFNQPYDVVFTAGGWQVALVGDFSGRVRVERARVTEMSQQ